MSRDDDSVSNAKLNWLRAAVLGANDGIVSVAAIILGVAGATNARGAIFTAGLAGLVAGACSMAVGEYVSVSSQRDTERAFISREKRRLREDPAHELDGLAQAYIQKGISEKTARQMAAELSKKDALKAHLEVELQLDEDDLTNPGHAAVASFISFTAGALVPLATAVFVTKNWRIGATFAAVLITLTLTGYLSAMAGGAPRLRAMLRVVAGGAVAMIATYGIGHLFGAAIS